MIQIRQSGAPLAVYIGVFIVLGISIFAAVINYVSDEKETVTLEPLPENQDAAAVIDEIGGTTNDLLEAARSLNARLENTEDTQTELQEAVGALVARLENTEGTQAELQEAADVLASRAENIISKIERQPEESADVERAYQAVVGATVQINTPIGSLGTGFIYDSSGLILTAAHVLTVRPDEPQTFSSVEVIVNQNGGGIQAVRGRILGIDLDTDIGVVKINPNEVDFRAARLGLNSNVRLGETVITVGSHHAFQNTFTSGVVSDPKARGPIGQRGTPVEHNLIQTDASINGGVSGGPLANLNGEIIGVVTLYHTTLRTSSSPAPLSSDPPHSFFNVGNIGIGFALSIIKAKEIADTIVAANPG